MWVSSITLCGNPLLKIAGLRAETLDLVEEILDALKQSSIRSRFSTRSYPGDMLAGPSSGLHLHLSTINLNGERASPEDFLAGILNHMSSLCAFEMANYDGYVRSVGDAAGAWIGFGTDNRDLLVRKINDWHWEFRTMDGTANPYLFVAAVLLAALDGLARKTELVWKDCKVFPHLMDKRMRVEYGINNSMPATLKEALYCLRSDAVIIAWIPADFLTWYLSVVDKEVEKVGKMTDGQRRLRSLEDF
ncbi:Glutamine synthetase [Metarhizium acridum CQMa 102]|uniref:Glutamine synthetase n=1 Tax=Metarhizium acridum (strain CQMa 102) TaxID=655827 RepID=E9E3L7_METAQ|nr:Glutamine synthetase [Metarhizium acridum CQMa 102]EFY89442.1 Glutamine synthetase [Metarhizium acridum CQMa 102]